MFRYLLLNYRVHIHTYIKASLSLTKPQHLPTINRAQICIDLKLCVRAFPSFIISSPLPWSQDLFPVWERLGHELKSQTFLRLWADLGIRLREREKKGGKMKSTSTRRDTRVLDFGWSKESQVKCLKSKCFSVCKQAAEKDETVWAVLGTVCVCKEAPRHSWWAILGWNNISDGAQALMLLQQHNTTKYIKSQLVCVCKDGAK